MTRHTCNPFHATEAEVAACPGCGAGDNYEGWRAHAEELAGAVHSLINQRDDYRHLAFPEEATRFLGSPLWGDAATALARLPAQALAERRALEAKAAHAEALAAAVHEWSDHVTFCEPCAQGDSCLAYGTLRRNAAAAADRLPAQALAERQKLEACENRLRVMVREWEEIIGTEEENRTPGDVLERAKAALTALNAVRRTP